MSDIEVITHSERVEALFAPFRDTLGSDYLGYRNHVYRCISYAMYFHPEQASRSIVETAFVYHDIGLWTDRACAYLEPSEARALEDNERFGWGFDPEALRAAIHW
ncbi:MAG: phosphohydrolase, partial [Myxococcota bacterium]